MKNRFEGLCVWLDDRVENLNSLTIDSENMFIELLRFYGSIRMCPFRNHNDLREFLKGISAKQSKGMLVERWLVSSERVQFQRLRNNKPRIFTFTRADSHPKKRV